MNTEEALRQRGKYLSEQRKMGEITVAMRLLTDLLRVFPEDQDLMVAINGLSNVLKRHARTLRKLEAEAGCVWGGL